MMIPQTDNSFPDKVSLLDRFIREASDVAVIGHFNPDGDSVGSLMAMFRYISGRGLKCTPLLPSTHPPFLNFLDSGHDILFFSGKDSAQNDRIYPEKVYKTVQNADLIICLDLSSPTRTEGIEAALRETHCRRVLIDHHQDPELNFFDLAFSYPDESSASELLFWILMAMPDINGDITALDYKIAESLATGMVSDTNNFCNSVIPTTFTMSSLLLERGVSLEDIYHRIFCCYSSSRMKLMGEMISLMNIDKSLHAACMVLTQDLQHKYGYMSGDSEGFVNIGLKMNDVEVSALFTEEKDKVRVSLRSKGLVSVRLLSNRFFNGGGHEKASGGKLTLPINQVRDYYFSSLGTFLHDEGITFASSQG